MKIRIDVEIPDSVADHHFCGDRDSARYYFRESGITPLLEGLAESYEIFEDAKINERRSINLRKYHEQERTSYRTW